MRTSRGALALLALLSACDRDPLSIAPGAPAGPDIARWNIDLAPAIPDLAVGGDLSVPIDVGLPSDLAALADLAPAGDGGGAQLVPPKCGDSSGLQANSPWPMFGRCPTHIALSPYRGPRNGRLMWQARTGLSAY